ncbi:hypothetical protein TSUD_23130 [Trifolium subterraneum]|uniref:Trichome birefringence-like C-terminal domain-containing protein n=1 Tax=Trifolium subterraneum TaxID=3900 RepID=A0A2Z6N2S0_TRISU|nr:hypothetical protein TSUD_23130 [Trifolium subterraneum]
MSKIYEVNGSPISKHKGYLIMKFEEYNMTVEYYRVPFLSPIGRPPLNLSNDIKTTIRLDELHWYSIKWKGVATSRKEGRNGTWNEGGNCDKDMEPENDPTKLETDPYYNIFISDAVKEMQYGSWKVNFLNITYLSEMRKDGHPSKYRELGTPPDAPQDCSHWCLPGVPDTWNTLIYAQLLSKKFGINKYFSESEERS